MRPLEPYDPSEPGAPTPGTRAGTPPLPDIESAYDFGTLDALRQLREQFPHSRILLDLDSQTPEIVVKVEAPPSIVARVGDEPGSDASSRDGGMPEAAPRAATAARR
jgi:hypothetical protein